MFIVIVICYIIAMIILAIFHFLSKNSLINDFDDELKIIRNNRKFFNKKTDSENKTLMRYWKMVFLSFMDMNLLI